MKRAVYILFLLLSFQYIRAQDVHSFLDKVHDFNLNNPQEKIYLHLDKYSYTAGETIWFKAYATIGIENFLSKRSQIGYVELIDPSERLVASARISLMNGVGMGNLTLIDTLTEGSYRIRAYTQWMRNYDPAYFYDRTLQISNGRTDDVQTTSSLLRMEKQDRYSILLRTHNGIPLNKTRVNYEFMQDGIAVSSGRTTTDAQGSLVLDMDHKHQGALIKLRFENLANRMINKVIKPVDLESHNSVQLFPEGGKILGGTTNNIAVKAIDPKGFGIKAKVFLIAGRDTLSVIETNELGMGSAYVFIANDADNLSASALFDDGNSVVIAMPEVHTRGYSIVVRTQDKDRLLTQINMSDEHVDQRDLYFVLHHLGQVYFVSKQKALGNELVFAVEKAGLPTGIVTISILNSDLVPILERAVFNYASQNVLTLSATLNKPTYQVRDSVLVDVFAGHNVDSMRLSLLSASVVNLTKIKDEYQNAPNILTTLLLNSDLKGFVESPGFYFQDTHPRLHELDQLMLTQGWRNINWDRIGTSGTPEFEAEKGIKISGYTRKAARKVAEPHAAVQLISTQNFMDYLDTLSNAEGYFEFDNFLFPDSVKFLISARTEKGKSNVDIVFNTIERPATTANPNAPMEINDINRLFSDQIEQSKRYFAELEERGLMDKMIVIEEVVVHASTQKQVSEHSSNLNGPGNADQVLTEEDLTACSTLEMCLAGRLFGVMWIGGVPYNTRSRMPLQIVMDGMFIESDELSTVNVADIASVEVLRNLNYTTVYGMDGSNGLLILTSKIGKSAMKNYVPRGILTIQPQGIAVARDFYKPTYDVADAVKLARDLRTTIHWEPDIVTDIEGRANFKFFTSDEAGKYLMVLEGVDLNGRLGRALIEIDVKSNK